MNNNTPNTTPNTTIAPAYLPLKFPQLCFVCRTPQPEGTPAFYAKNIGMTGSKVWCATCAQPHWMAPGTPYAKYARPTPATTPTTTTPTVAAPPPPVKAFLPNDEWIEELFTRAFAFGARKNITPADQLAILNKVLTKTGLNNAPPPAKITNSPVAETTETELTELPSYNLSV